MKSKKETERIIKAFNITARSEMDKKICNDVSNVIKRSKQTKLSSMHPDIRSKIIKSPIIKIAAAAVITICCLTGLHFWRSTGSGIALADVLTQIEKVKAVKYKTTFKVFGSKDPNELWANERWIMLMSQEYGWISTSVEHDPNGEEITGTIQYYYPQKGLEIRINNAKKTYTRRVTDSQTQNEPSQSQEEPISSLLKEILNTKHESIGKSIIEGVEVEGFQTTDPDYKFKGYRYKGPRFTNINEDPRSDAKLWVDVKTLLPVRIEYLTSDTYDGGKTRSFLQEVDYNFQWDVPVDASSFEAPPIPDDYAIKDIFPELANEEDAIGGLKQCVELFGNYPEKIDLTFLWVESEKSETAAAIRLKEELKGLTGLERDNMKMEALKLIRYLNKFYIGLTKKDPTYYGKTVTPKDTNKVLMRWKVLDNEYRIIFGDLSTKTVTTEELAELEKQ